MNEMKLEEIGSECSLGLEFRGLELWREFWSFMTSIVLNV